MTARAIPASVARAMTGTRASRKTLQLSALRSSTRAKRKGAVKKWRLFSRFRALRPSWATPAAPVAPVRSRHQLCCARLTDGSMAPHAVRPTGRVPGHATRRSAGRRRLPGRAQAWSFAGIAGPPTGGVLLADLLYLRVGSLQRTLDRVLRLRGPARREHAKDHL